MVAEGKKKKTAIGCVVLLAIVIIIAVVIGTCLAGQPEPSPKPSDVGSEATIQMPNLEVVYLPIDEQALDEWTNACVAKDYIGMAQLEASGRVFTVPNGTKVLVIDSRFATRQVRVLEGDAFGKSGWLPYEWLK